MLGWLVLCGYILVTVVPVLGRAAQVTHYPTLDPDVKARADAATGSGSLELATERFLDNIRAGRGMSPIATDNVYALMAGPSMTLLEVEQENVRDRAAKAA